jgi:hypothetical protein
MSAISCTHGNTAPQITPIQISSMQSRDRRPRRALGRFEDGGVLQQAVVPNLTGGSIQSPLLQSATCSSHTANAFDSNIMEIQLGHCSARSNLSAAASALSCSSCSELHTASEPAAAAAPACDALAAALLPPPLPPPAAAAAAAAGAAAWLIAAATSGPRWLTTSASAARCVLGCAPAHLPAMQGMTSPHTFRQVRHLHRRACALVSHQRDMNSQGCVPWAHPSFRSEVK